MQNQQMPNQVATATVEGTRARERPCRRWRGKVQEDLNIMRIKKLGRDHWGGRKIVLEAKVHNRLQCCRRRRRRRNKRKGIIIIIIIIIIHFNQYLMYKHYSTGVSYKASTKTQTQKQYKYTKMKTLNKQQYSSSKKMSGINAVLGQKP